MLILDQPTVVSGRPSESGASEPVWATSRKILFTTDQDKYLNPWEFDINDSDFRQSKASPLSSTVIHEDFGEPYWSRKLNISICNTRLAKKIGNSKLVELCKTGRRPLRLFVIP